MAQNIKRINGVAMGSQELNDTRLLADADAYYQFSTGALTTDSSGNSHTLTAIGDPAEIAGKYGGGVDLDGDDAYSATDHADFKPTGAFSVGCWYKTTGTSFQVLFASYSANSNYAGIHMGTAGTTHYPYISSNRNTGTTENTDYVNCIGTSATNNGVWHFMVGVWDTSLLKLYIDGLLVNHVSWTHAPGYAATNYVRVGCRNTTGTNASFFTGQLDDVFLMNGKALTPDEISMLYSTGIKRLNRVYNVPQELEGSPLRNDANLVGYWRFEDNALDETTNNNDLTLSGSPAYTTGKFGKGLDLEYSSSQYASITDALQTGLDLASDFTFEAWIKPEQLASTLGAAMMIVAKDGVSPANTRSYSFYVNSDNTLFCDYFDSAGNRTAKDSDSGVIDTAGIWYHVAVTCDISAHEMVFYVNGSSVASGGTTVSATSINNSATAFDVGARAYVTAPRYFDGVIDEVAVFSRVLTATEISNLYNSNIKKYMGVDNK